MRANSGFTLLELMITVVILSIVVTIAVPSFLSLLQTNRLSGQVNQFVGAIHAARTEAIKMNRNVVFCHSSDGVACSPAPATGWEGWLIALAAPGAGGGAVANSIMASGFVLSNNIVIRTNNSIATNNSEIRFSPQGLVRTRTGTPLNGVIRICATNTPNNNARDMLIRSGGHIAVNQLSSAACAAP